MKRRASTIMICLAALAIASLLFGSQAVMLASRQRTARMHLRHLNALALANSALERARIRAQFDRNYRGETWEPAITEGEARKAIIVVSQEGSIARVAIEAILGGEDEHPIRVQLERPLEDRRTE